MAFFDRRFKRIYVPVTVGGARLTIDLPLWQCCTCSRVYGTMAEVGKCNHGMRYSPKRTIHRHSKSHEQLKARHYQISDEKQIEPYIYRRDHLGGWIDPHKKV